VSLPSVRLCGIELAHPVVNGSGTLDALVAGTLGVAGYVTKTVTLHPRAGNPPPRIAETPAGMLNSIGLANPGLDSFCARHLPALAELGIPLIVSVGGWSREEYATLVRRLAAEPAVCAIELNVSCPNVDKGGLEFGCDPAAAARVTAAVRAATRLPLWVKMSPEAGDLKGVGLACQEAGADALTAINTIRGLSIDVRTGRPRLANRTGGLSGPALKPIALRMVWELSRTVGIPVIGIGGIATTEDALEFLLAGATAIQVGTANFADPLASKKILDGLRAYCEAARLDARDLVARAH
jgi:dihydroorotate dehydrogenase (NAD+) catalytic subunit